jgi:CubicO group peptidase (beta-lactamase class C family)
LKQGNIKRNNKRDNTRIKSGILSALLILGFANAGNAYAQQPESSVSPASIKLHAELSSAAAADVQNGPHDAKEVEAFLDGFFARADIKAKAGAAAVSVVQDGGILISKGYGVTGKSAKSGVDASRDTFRIGSVSKVFTAAAIMQLADQGKISLQDNIEKYLDGYTLTNPYDTPVTVEHLLTHTTGFEVREPADASYLYDTSRKPVSLKESIYDVFPPVVREPGTSYMYDNFASRLQGYLVQQVSGESFGSYVENHLFKPLGMNSSSFRVTPELADRLVPSYDGEGGAIPLYGFSPAEWPEGSMLSTASDMALFMEAFLNGGKAADGTVILSGESVKAMSSYRMVIHPDLPDTTYGFESPVIPARTKGEKVISKGGDILGYSSLLWILPDRRTGVFVSYNTNQDLRNDLFTAFMNHYYAGGQSPYEPKGYQVQAAEELGRFEGLYSDLRIKLLTKVQANADGTLTVSDVLSRHQLKQIGELLFVDEEGNPLAFKADNEGHILYMKYSNLYSYASKLPENPAGFPDVPANHPYAGDILSLRSLGFLTEELSEPFEPEQKVTRGAFIHTFNTIWSIPESSNPSLFKDTGNSPYQQDVQAAAEAGMLNGTGNGLFEPDRPILREEAAAIVYRLLTAAGIRVPGSTAVLAPGTSKWAADAVRSIVSWKLHGPEVTESDGMSDYGSLRALSKQEMAALLFRMLLPQ